MEAKFGKSLEELADSLVFKPAKMNDTHFWWDKSMDEKRYVKNYDKDGKAFETIKYYILIERSLSHLLNLTQFNSMQVSTEDFTPVLHPMLSSHDTSAHFCQVVCASHLYYDTHYHHSLRLVIKFNGCLRKLRTGCYPSKRCFIFIT